MVSPSRFVSYAVLVALEGDTGTLLRDSGDQRVPLAELGPQWSGEFTLVWQPPGDYAGPVSRGDRGPMVTWLAQAFAGDEFNAALETRVKLFQRRFNLLDDGVVGLKTLLKLNAVRGEEVSLRRGGEGIARVEQD